MTELSTEQILSAPVNLLRQSNEEERGVFPKDQKGWFYTFGLKSGQSFVANFDGINDGFIFRPLNNLVPQLVEFQWKKQYYFGNSPLFSVFCQITSGTSMEEKKLLEQILSPKREERNECAINIIGYRYPEMLAKARDVKRQLLANERAQQELLKGQERLRSLMIPNSNDSTNQTTQYTINERRQKNG